MTYDEFQRELAAGQVRQSYLFLGDEDWLAESGCRAVIAAALPGPEREFGLTLLGPEAQPAEVKSALLSSSFFSAKRVVWARDPGKMATETLEALANQAPHLPATTLLLVSGQQEKTRKAGKALLAAVPPVNCQSLNKSAAMAWARARATRLGLILNPEAADFLVETAGVGLRQLAMELDKALAYLGGERTEITRGDLSLLLGHEREDDVFRMVEAAAEGRMAEALTILGDLIALGEPEARLMVLLERQVRLVLMTGYLKAQGRRPSEIAGALQDKPLPPFVVDRLLRQSARLSAGRCAEILERMLEADVGGKVGERDPRVELELIIIKMAS